MSEFLLEKDINSKTINFNFFKLIMFRVKEINLKRPLINYTLLCLRYTILTLIISYILVVFVKSMNMILDNIKPKNNLNLIKLSKRNYQGVVKKQYNIPFKDFFRTPILTTTIKEVIDIDIENSNVIRTTSIFPNIANDISNLTKIYDNPKTSQIKKCPDYAELETLQGRLNIYDILEKLNLSTLVQLHEPNTYNLVRNHYRVPIELFYLEEKNLNNSNKHPRFDEFWELWHTKNMSILNISKELLGSDGNRVELGGSWRPKDCVSRDKIVIIIPFRDRIPHLRVNLEFMHSLLQKQMLDYRIFVVEGNYPPDMPFNKGRIMNAGFLEILKIYPKLECNKIGQSYY